jgi:hypothetical protein
MNKKLAVLFVATLFILTACGSQNGIPKSQFSTAEQVAYNFTENVYSGDKDKQSTATREFASKDDQLQMILGTQMLNGVFDEHYSDIKVMKLIKETEKGKMYQYILVKLTNDEGSIENVLSVRNNKVQLVLSPKDKVFKKSFEEYRKKF